MKHRALALFIVAAGCAADPSPDAPQDANGRQVQDGASHGADATANAAWQRCQHGQGGFTIEYPAGWQTNDDRVMPGCMLFDPSAIEVPYASELPADIAVGIRIEEVPYDRVAGEMFGIRVLSREEWTVAGRPGLRRLVEQTGDGLLDAGIRSWQYIAGWDDGRTLVAVSHDVGEPGFDTKRRVLDEMIARLQPR